jgi:hypothetical protein
MRHKCRRNILDIKLYVPLYYPSLNQLRQFCFVYYIFGYPVTLSQSHSLTNYNGSGTELRYTAVNDSVHILVHIICHVLLE